MWYLDLLTGPEESKLADFFYGLVHIPALYNSLFWKIGTNLTVSLKLTSCATKVTITFHERFQYKLMYARHFPSWVFLTLKFSLTVFLRRIWFFPPLWFSEHFKTLQMKICESWLVGSKLGLVGTVRGRANSAICQQLFLSLIPMKEKIMLFIQHKVPDFQEWNLSPACQHIGLVCLGIYSRWISLCWETLGRSIFFSDFFFLLRKEFILTLQSGGIIYHPDNTLNGRVDFSFKHKAPGQTAFMYSVTCSLFHR